MTKQLTFIEYTLMNYRYGFKQTSRPDLNNPFALNMLSYKSKSCINHQFVCTAGITLCYYRLYQTKS